MSQETQVHLRSHKVSRVARGHEQAVVGTQLLSEAEVTDPDGLGIARLVNVENVTGLQVSVDHLENRFRTGVRTEEKITKFKKCYVIYKYNFSYKMI